MKKVFQKIFGFILCLPLIVVTVFLVVAVLTASYQNMIKTNLKETFIGFGIAIGFALFIGLISFLGYIGSRLMSYGNKK